LNNYNYKIIKQQTNSKTIDLRVLKIEDFLVFLFLW